MKITLNGFENQINEIILERGYDYYKEGNVIEIEELEEGEYEITVEGSELYTVNLTIQRNVISDYYCDCPYDMGPVCKHVVAALYYLKENNEETTKPKPKEKSITKQAEELLETLSHEELKAYVRNVCSNDNKFRQLFVTRHIHILSPSSQELYKKQVQALVKSYSGSYGLIDYSAVKSLSRAVRGIVDEARLNLTKGQPRTAMFMALAIAEELVEIISYGADDSNGELGNCMENAFEILEELTETDLDKDLHNELFNHLVRLFEMGVFKNFDWHFSTVSLAIQLCTTIQEEERIKAALNKIKSNGTNWDWDYHQAQNMMLALIEKTGNNKSAIQYMEQNLSNSDFRSRMIEDALDIKDYSKAKILAEEGVAKDSKNAPGLADQWRNYLLAIAQRTVDTETIIRLSRYFLVHSGGRYYPLKYYYDTLKGLIPDVQWNDYLENLIIGIKGKGRWIDYNRISQLYIWEKRWGQLLELLRQDTSFERITDAEPYLSKSYSTELVTLYRECILNYLEHNMGRSHYQKACYYINRIKKLSAQPMAKELIQELKTTYSNRRALIEELNKI